MRTLLRNAVLADGRRVDVGVGGEGKVAEVGSRVDAAGYDRCYDLEGALLFRGFVDCHMHLDKALMLRGGTGQPVDPGPTTAAAPGRGTLSDAIALSRRLKETFTRENVKERARSMVDRAIGFGTTLIRTHVDIDPIVGLTGFEALLELREEYGDRIQMQVVAFPQEGLVGLPEVQELMAQALRMGADAVGGIPAGDTEPREHLRIIFDLAERFSLPLDVHIDESADPEDLAIIDVAEETIRRNLQGRVTAGHCCTLDLLPPDRLEPVMDLIAEAEVNIVALPSTNLYLQGRGDEFRVRRGLAPVRRLLDRGIRVAFASDNTQDAFNPFGRGDILDIAWLGAHCSSMGSEAELDQVFGMVSVQAAAVLGVDHRVEVGAPATLVALVASSPAQVIVDHPQALFRLFRGRAISGVREGRAYPVLTTHWEGCADEDRRS